MNSKLLGKKILLPGGRLMVIIGILQLPWCRCLHGDPRFVAELESRFTFHSVNEFPAPDDYTNCAKMYISKEQSEFLVDCYTHVYCSIAALSLIHI